MEKLRKGIWLALITAFISGIAIFLNGFFVTKLVKDPFILTSIRNSLVAVFLTGLVLGILKISKLKKISPKQWGQLILIGIIGGSIPFLLFFKGLSISSAAAVNGAFIHKTLFLWVTFLALIFLKERLSFWQVVALGTLLFGIYLSGGPKNWHFGQGELLVFIAVLFWAVEFVIAKIALKNLPSIIVAWGRMFFGALILLCFLIFTGRIENIGKLNILQWTWILNTAILLGGFVISWYAALKRAPASVVTCVLTLGFPITVILNLVFQSAKIDYLQILGLILTIISILIINKIALGQKGLKLKYV